MSFAAAAGPEEGGTTVTARVTDNGGATVAAGALGANTLLFINVPSSFCRLATASATAGATHFSATQLRCSVLTDHETALGLELAVGGSGGSGGAMTLGATVSLNGLDSTAEAAHFELLPKATAHSLLPARAPATGNTTVLESGDGFVDAGDAPGQRAHMLSRFASSREVECIAPPGPRPEVQLITLEDTDAHFRARISGSSVGVGTAAASAEVQRVEVVALPDAREVQSVAVEARGPSISLLPSSTPSPAPSVPPMPGPSVPPTTALSPLPTSAPSPLPSSRPTALPTVLPTSSHCARAAVMLAGILIMSASSAAALAPVNTVVVARDAAGRAPVTASASAHGFYRRRLLSGDYGWTTYEIYTSADDVFSVFGIDLDGDGDVDVLSASRTDKTIAWYENLGGSGWSYHEIYTAADGARSVFGIDLDGDGDVDVLSASQNDDTIAWSENLDGSGGSWSYHEISTAADGAFSVFGIDLDGDGDVDVLSASQNDDTIAWCVYVL